MLKATELRKELTFDIIVTAVEQGIYYWARVRKYHWDMEENVASVEVLDAEGESTTWVKVDQDWVEAALTKVRTDKSIQMREDILAAILLADRTDGQRGDIDAEAADVLFQIGMFGEIVYG